MENYGMSPADYAAVSGNNRNGIFGDDGIWIVVLFLMMWGNNGANGAGFQGYATRADINEGFALNGLENGIRGIQQGLCDSTYALNNGMMQGFAGVDRGFNSLSSQLADCCCQNREAIAQVRYDMATQNCATNNNIQNVARDIIESTNAGTRAILDKMCQQEIDALKSRNADLLADNNALRFAQSQTAQNQGSPQHTWGKGFLCTFCYLRKNISSTRVQAKAHRCRRHCRMVGIPHACGDKKNLRKLSPGRRGSPPRMRGQVLNTRQTRRSGSITPAYAGTS